MKRLMICILILVSGMILSAVTLDEAKAKAIQSWLNTPFSSGPLETERGAKLGEYQNLVKGEFETSAQFEQRKKDAAGRIAAIQNEYEQKIAEARASHEILLAKLRVRLLDLVNSSRETVTLEGSLGTYDPETQRFPISIPSRTFNIVIPLGQAPDVKKNFSSYQFKVTRQLNESLEWGYLEAKLEGPLGSFASTDKAPVVNQSSVSLGLIPPDLIATVSFNEPSGDQVLDAEETATVNITIRNSGQGSAKMLEASFELLNAPGISYAREQYFGEVKPGETVSKTLQLVAGMDSQDGQAELKISFKEQNGFPPNDISLKFGTRALSAPDVVVADIGIEDFSGNNKIEPGEQVEVRARIHNRGLGMAKNVNAQVLLGKDVYLFGNSPSSFDLGDMASGTFQDISFSIVSARTAKDLDLKLDLRENRSQFSKLAQPLNLAFNRVERTADQMVVAGNISRVEITGAPALSIDIEQDVPTRGTADKNRWGVIFGIENYRNVSSVRFAKRDAVYMQEYFIKTLGIKAENIYVKTDDDATLGEFKNVFDPQGWLSKNAGKKDSEIFIYFSGHGVPTPDGKQAYLLPYEGNPNYAMNSAYGLNQLYDNLSAIPVKSITLFLDSCFSGANRDNEIILADARPVFLASAPKIKASHISVFSAASGAQISSAYAEKQHGLFSYYLMKGLRGEADANQDRRLSQAELQEYINEQVSGQARRMGREQEPQLQSGDPAKVMIQR